MNELMTLRIDLGINAQKIMSQMQIHNEDLEKQIEKGLNLGLADILADDSFVQHVREHCKKEMQETVNRAMLSWETRGKIQKMIEEKIGLKINEFADQIAEKIVSVLEK